jgi:hypothetical protein
MSELNLSLRHHRTLDDARVRLEETVREAQARFGAMIQKVEWSPDRNSVTLSGTGFTGRVWVDAQEVHAVVDVPLLARLLATPVVKELKGLLEERFTKQLPG